MRAHLLSVLGYVVATFGVQGTSHFAINAAHYSALPHMRAEPLVAFGILSMLIQGSVLSWAYSRSAAYERGLAGALAASWALGLVIVSYIALAEFGKYEVPGFASWAATETGAGAVQFTFAGMLLYLAHHGLRRSALARSG